MSFYRERLVKAVRKARKCVGCRTEIAVGQPSLDCAGHYDGDFWSGTYHPECRAAEVALNQAHGVDEWMTLDDLESEDLRWLLEEHPAVADRMKVTAEVCDQLEEQERLSRTRWLAMADQP